MVAAGTLARLEDRIAQLERSQSRILWRAAGDVVPVALTEGCLVTSITAAGSAMSAASEFYFRPLIVDNNSVVPRTLKPRCDGDLVKGTNRDITLAAGPNSYIVAGLLNGEWRPIVVVDGGCPCSCSSSSSSSSSSSPSSSSSSPSSSSSSPSSSPSGSSAGSSATSGGSSATSGSGTSSGTSSDTSSAISSISSSECACCDIICKARFLFSDDCFCSFATLINSGGGCTWENTNPADCDGNPFAVILTMHPPSCSYTLIVTNVLSGQTIVYTGGGGPGNPTGNYSGTYDNGFGMTVCHATLTEVIPP